MENKKKCPIMKGLDCMKSECACYDESYEECTILSIGNSLATLCVMIDNKELSIGVFDDN